MYLAKVTFGSQRKGKSRARLDDLADIYISSLFHMRQRQCDAKIAWVHEKLVAYVNVPRPDSMDLRYHSETGKEALQKVIKAFGCEPQWEILDDHVPTRFPDWRKSPFFVLFTTMLEEDAPIRRGTDGYPFPQYLFPMEDCDKHNINCWEDYYQSYDVIWLRSGKLEIPTYRQMAEPFSELTKEGKNHCEDIERATQIPTYYYLTRYWGRSNLRAEANRPCPSCGGKWRLKQPYVWRSPRLPIVFLCKRCRLVSSAASVNDEERYAHIGEYKGA
ncbi:MAG: DUF2310 family Zn-ribbon-containing protein [Candidatus Sumerlaeota bacterium]|nr:DUF2310 family Zn-ribbon-containing protein [Candidatus Sumerlaeota bacterium]